MPCHPAFLDQTIWHGDRSPEVTQESKAASFPSHPTCVRDGGHLQAAPHSALCPQPRERHLFDVRNELVVSGGHRVISSLSVFEDLLLVPNS